MSLRRWSIPVAVVALSSTALIAALLVWLLLNEPVALAGVVDHGDLTEAAQAVGRALLEGLKALARYL